MGQAAEDPKTYVDYYTRYVTAALAHPSIIGYNKCRYQDQETRGMLKQGLLTLNGEPYPTVTGIADANREALRRAYGTR